MGPRLAFFARCLLVTTLTLLGFVAVPHMAQAQQVSSKSTENGCQTTATTTSTDVTTRNRLTTSATQLLPADGIGFFAADVQRIVLYVADGGLDETVVAERQIRTALTGFYDADEVSIETSSEAPPAQTDALTRNVVITGDVAVPGQPAVFSLNGDKTLYLHWSTAERDMARLLDVPSFETIATDTPAERAPASDCSPANSLGDAPEDLAFVTDEPGATNEANDTSFGDLVSIPLADSAPNEQWPFPVAAAAIAVTAGGIVVHRRHEIFGNRDTNSPATPAAAEIMKPRYPVPDRAPAKPRVVYVDGETRADEDSGHSPDVASKPARREIDLHASRSESALTRSVEKLSTPHSGAAVPSEEFASLITAEWSRQNRGGKDGAVASLVLSELDAVRLRLGSHAAEQLIADVAAQISTKARALDVIGFASDNELAILMPEVDEADALEALDEIVRAIAARTFTVGEERVLLTPATGFAMLSDTHTAPDLVRAVESARALSMLSLDLDPARWDGEARPPHTEGEGPSATWAALKDKLRTPLQIALTVVIAWVIPFFLYVGMAAVGFDISFLIYVLLVASLVITGAFILAEGYMAIDQKEPPEVPTVAYPKASALIAAYLPNEAATVIETIEAFLALDYPNEIQIILAYNTPDPLPVEEHLDRIALEHPNFVPVRVVGSNSKAQNVNAVLSMADGEFIGMFDADHQPRPDAFTRAWRWIDSGYDVVQGHCLTRNGDASFLAKMIAVEFESIYAVAHPGRAKMHRFGVFGGSNGFWRTELLHETRMRGSMLTEDIDSSMRVIERGFKIRSDRDLVSRELATTTFKQVWNQRMRWAQGWFQVSLEHMKLSFKSKDLTIRQKLGLFHLLMWREFYPWLSQQLIPLLAFWAIQAGGIGRLNWTLPIFLATTIFTFSVGPLQTIFAYKLADPEIKQHKAWFWGYLLFTTPFYTEYKNLIARVAHVKQFMGESNWRVTPRSADADDDEI